MSTGIQEAQQLADSLTTVFQLAHLDALVTLNSADVKPQTPLAAIITPPTIEFTTYTIRQQRFKIDLVAGPPRDPLTAWKRLDQAIDIISGSWNINLKTADPAQFHTGAETLPAYILTLN